MFGGEIPNLDSKIAPEIWMSKDDETWTQSNPINPPPGEPLGTAMVTLPRDGGPDRLFLLGTFKTGTTTTSLMYEWQDGNKVWHKVDVGQGWETFQGGHFGLRAVSFEGRIYLWSVSNRFRRQTGVRLNILV